MKTESTSRLPLRKKLLFSTGDLSTSIPLAILMFFQLYFLTDVAGLPPLNAAWAVGLSRLWDAVNDPLFGLWSDTHPHPLGTPTGSPALRGGAARDFVHADVGGPAVRAAGAHGLLHDCLYLVRHSLHRGARRLQRPDPRNDLRLR